MRGLLQVRLPAVPNRLDMINLNNLAQNTEITMIVKSHRGTLTAQPRGTPGTMRICVTITREIVVDYMADMAEIQAAAGYVRSHHDFDFLSPKSIEKRRSPGLIQASVYKLNRLNLPAQSAKEFFGIDTRITEYYRLSRIVLLKVFHK